MYSAAQKREDQDPPLRLHVAIFQNVETLFLDHFQNFHHVLLDIAVVFTLMGTKAAGAVLIAIFRIRKIAAAFVAQSIQGAKTE